MWKLKAHHLGDVQRESLNSAIVPYELVKVEKKVVS